MKITVGIPKALEYYYQKDFWQYFFSYLDVKTIISDNTNNQIIENGSFLCCDEACIGLKIYLGHINNLKDKCDYILVPRIYSFKKDEQVCTYYNALYDIVNNTFKDIKILNYNIDYNNHHYIYKAYLEVAKTLGFSYIKALNAYFYAKNKTNTNKQLLITKQNKLLTSSKIKILLAGHNYIIRDNYLTSDIIKYLKDNNIEIIYSDILEDKYINYYKYISSDIHWTYNKYIMSSIYYYKDYVDGIILLEAFICGPDSLANYMIKKKIDLPILNLLFENSFSKVGVVTRLESFIDILNFKRRLKDETNN